MLLRRITEHVKAQNWTAIAIDFVIVVVGVFIGIQVSNWNEDRQNDSRIQSYYQRLIQDSESEIQALNARLDYIAVTETYGEKALATLEDEVAMLSSEFMIALYQASQIWTYSVQRSTYDEILYSGIAEAIPDPKLRTRLANTYLSAELTRQVIVSETPYREKIRRYLPHEIQAAVRAHCSDVFSLSSQGLVTLRLPDSCTLGFAAEQVEMALESLRDYTYLKQELGQRLALLSVVRSAIEAHIPQIQQLIADIQAHQNSPKT
jgi:hypothetical protein